MAQNLLSGKSGSVNINGGSSMSFGKWACPMTCKAVPAHNWVSSPYEMYVPGLLGAKVTLDMPSLDSGNVGLSAGTAYTFLLNWTSILGLTVVGFITDLAPDNDVEGAPKLRVGVQVYGAFTASVA